MTEACFPRSKHFLIIDRVITEGVVYIYIDLPAIFDQLAVISQWRRLWVGEIVRDRLHCLERERERERTARELID